MHLTIFQILAFTFFFSLSLARNLHSSSPDQNLNVVANRSVSYREVPVELTKRDDVKYVFMHTVSSIQ